MATLHHIHQRPLPLDRRTPEGLVLDWIAAGAEIRCIDSDSYGRMCTMDEADRRQRHEEAREAISAEFKRRINAGLGTVKVDDLIKRGVL